MLIERSATVGMVQNDGNFRFLYLFYVFYSKRWWPLCMDEVQTNQHARLFMSQISCCKYLIPRSFEKTRQLKIHWLWIFIRYVVRNLWKLISCCSIQYALMLYVFIFSSCACLRGILKDNILYVVFCGILKERANSMCIDCGISFATLCALCGS